MRIFLTGSTGFLGKQIVRSLGEKYDIVEASRKKGVSILDKDPLVEKMRGCEIVIHAAAETNENSPDLWKTNVEGTRNVLEAGKKVGIKQFIHISTMGVYGSIAGTRINEDSPPKPVSTYEKSKKAAEDAVLEYRDFFAVTILRPTLIVGPNAYWKKIFEIVRKGYPIIGDGKNIWQLTYLPDVVSAIDYAIGNSRMYNESYLVVSEEEHSFRDIMNTIADIQGVKRPSTIPVWAGLLASHVLSVYGRIARQTVLLSPYNVKKLSENRRFDTRKLRELGWKSDYSLQKALSEMYDVSSGQFIEKIE